MDKRLIDIDKVVGYIEERLKSADNTEELWRLQCKLVDGYFDADPIPLPTIKPGDTRQLLHNTIDVMTDEQVQMVAKSLCLEVSHD